jgi:primosomal protein N' (replication factor Y) (superfamily II helicase)
VAKGKTERAAKALAEELAARLGAQVEGVLPAVRILGPAPAPMARLRGAFRYQIQLQSADGTALRDAVLRATADLKASDGASWIVDVDPIDMM